MSPLRPVAFLIALSSLSLAAQEFELSRYISDAEGHEVRGQGDFNNDGIVDLLAAQTPLDWSAIRVLLGDGQGNFDAQLASPFDGPFSTYWMEQEPGVGDFDGDGNLDVVVDMNQVTTIQEGVQIFRGTGTGVFQAPDFIDFDRGVLALGVGNIDADPADEFFVRYTDFGYTHHVVWVDWNGSAFVPLAAHTLGPDGFGVRAPGDFDLDGDDDILAVTASLTVMRLFVTTGGTVAPGPSWPIAPELQHAARSLRSGDLDGDGDLDAMMIAKEFGADGPYLQVYENVGGTLFQHPAQYVHAPELDSANTYHLGLTDWDGDGWLDPYTSGQELVMFRSNGNWTYSPAFQQAGTGYREGAGAFDANGDGHVDIAGGQILHLGDGVFEPVSAPTGLYFPPDFLAGLVPADLEGDGDVDLLGGPEGAHYVNDASGLWTLEDGGLPETPLGSYEWGEPVAFDDFDGDGRAEFLTPLLFDFGTSVGFVEMHLHGYDGKGGYTEDRLAALPLSEITGPATGGYLGTADVDGDGDVDLLADGGYWVNDGTGFFDPFVPAWDGQAWDGADVDGDGNVDLVLTRSLGSNSELVGLRASGGGYLEKVLGTYPGHPRAVMRDLDGDGDADVAAAEPGVKSLALVENEAGNLITRPSLAVLVPNLHLLGVADADGDGVLDLFVQREFGTGSSASVQLASLYRGTGGVNFEPLREFLTGHVLGVIDGFLDVDADGDLDAVGKIALENQVVGPTESGGLRQFGDGFAGTGDVVPVLGASGPATSTNPQGELRLVQGLGGGLAWLAVGPQEVAVVDQPLPGMTLYVGSPVLIPALPLGGSPGLAGAGDLALPLPQEPALFGLTFVLQAFGADAGSSTGWSASNGLEIVFGP